MLWMLWNKPTWFSLAATVSLAALALFVSSRLTKKLSTPIHGCTKEGAVSALGLMKDWTVWMAGMQTATIAAVGFLTKDAPSIFDTRIEVNLAIMVVIVNTLALLCSAWVLTAMSTLMLRIHRSSLPTYDIYTLPLYAYMEDRETGRITVGFVAFWNHLLWAVGILLFGLLSLVTAAGLAT